MTGIALNGKTPDFGALQAELVTAGVTILGGIGSDGTHVYTYNQLGQPSDFLAADAVKAAAVLMTHIAPLEAKKQRAIDAATLLNSNSVRDSQIHRDAFARLIGVRVLAIPLNQDATPTDIHQL